jgi:hypothetical protein
MTTFLSLLGYALVASLLLALIYASRSARLQHRFRKLGTLKGRSAEEVIKFAGRPSHRARMSGHREVLEWRRVGFHIALSFTDGICDGVDRVPEP